VTQDFFEVTILLFLFEPNWLLYYSYLLWCLYFWWSVPLLENIIKELFILSSTSWLIVKIMLHSHSIWYRLLLLIDNVCIVPSSSCIQLNLFCCHQELWVVSFIANWALHNILIISLENDAVIYIHNTYIYIEYACSLNLNKMY
jgi:hypothetical protein